MKVVINRKYGGFELSKKAKKILGIQYDYGISRTDERLIDVVEKLGGEASGSYAKLVVVEIPDDVDFYIEDYDGMETIHERHRIWGDFD